ncbi:hypothetical protein [Oryza sativa Japonica Group]|uniref:Uncharacterized protein n=1 Tax=Oryza sativa subsp. japonica TaxID=39947 RepID=Q94J95_ORYSJ|nr:hypothetical protein [Oryza sativa Japonica Group]BAD68221.1 hypothetical protein [Oryza sativa Japonica Group]
MGSAPVIHHLMGEDLRDAHALGTRSQARPERSSQFQTVERRRASHHRDGTGHTCRTPPNTRPERAWLAAVPSIIRPVTYRSQASQARSTPHLMRRAWYPWAHITDIRGLRTYGLSLSPSNTKRPLNKEVYTNSSNTIEFGSTPKRKIKHHTHCVHNVDT